MRWGSKRKSLRRRWSRTVVTAIGLAAGVGLVMGIVGVSDGLTQAQNKVLARSVLRSERPMGRLASLGFHWAYRRAYLSVAEELEAFSRVTLADLRRVLDRWPLLPLSLVSVGPTTDVHPPK